MLPGGRQRTDDSSIGWARASSGGNCWKNFVVRSTALPAQHGVLGSAEPGDVVATARRVVGQRADRLVDELRRRRLAGPVDAQLDGLVGDEAGGVRRPPRELVRGEVVRLAAVDLGRGGPC